MKNLIYGGLFLTLVGLSIVGCVKEVETIKIAQEQETNIDEPVFISKAEGMKGEKACSIKDAEGKEICAGKRCGTPVGECGRRETSCECIETSNGGGRLPEGMTFEEFQRTWNDSISRVRLESMGYYWVD
jgi:hypothetical protein